MRRLVLVLVGYCVTCVVLAQVGGSGIGGLTYSGAIAVSDCTQWASAGVLKDSGGKCLVQDANGHPVLAGLGAPGVTGSGCSLTSGGRDSTGSIVATGVDTCTLTFAGAFTTAPNCTVAGVGATVLPYLNALPTTGAAVFATTAAGTFTYTCF